MGVHCKQQVRIVHVIWTPKWPNSPSSSPPWRGGLAVALFMLVKKGRQRAEKLGVAFDLGTSKPAGVLGSAVDGLYSGYSCRYQIQYPSQYDRGGATLRFAITSPHQWSAEVTKPGTRMLAKFGLLKDFEIGDRELDEHFRFTADEEAKSAFDLRNRDCS